MFIEKALRERLLEMNGETLAALSDENRDALSKILRRDLSRVRRAKWTMRMVWALFLASFVTAVGLSQWFEDAGPAWLQSAGIASTLLFYLGLLAIVSYAVHSWIAWRHELQAHMVAVDARLTKIEERLGQPGM